MAARNVRGWQPVLWTVQQLAAHLDAESAIGAVYKDGYRTNDNARSQLIALDFDKGQPDRAAIEADILRLGCCSIIGETATPGHYRAVLPLAAIESDEEDFRTLFQRLDYFVHAELDLAGGEIGRQWFGFRTGTTRVIEGAFLTHERILELPAPPEAARNDQPRPRREKTSSTESPHSECGAEWLEWLNTVMLPALDRTAPVVQIRGKYEYRHCPNPAHANGDRTPSLRLSYDKTTHGSPVCSCGIHYERDKWDKLAAYCYVPNFKSWIQAKRAAHRQQEDETRSSEAYTASTNGNSTSDPGNQTAHEIFVHQHGVPDLFRTALLQQSKDAAWCYELITAATTRLYDFSPRAITIPELLRANIALACGADERTLRRALKALKEVFPSDSDTDWKTPVSESDGNSRRGRPADVWGLPPLAHQRQRLLELSLPLHYEIAYPAQSTEWRPFVLADLTKETLQALDEAVMITDEMVAALNVVVLPAHERQSHLRTEARKRAQQACDRQQVNLRVSCSTALPEGWPLHNSQAYICALLRAWKLDNPDNPRLKGNRKIASALGIHISSVPDYLMRAGIKVEGEQYVHFELTDQHDIGGQVTRFCRGKGKPRLIVSSPESEGGAPYAVETVVAWLAVGRVVYIRVQVANKHTVLEEATPITPDPSAARSPRKAEARPSPTSDSDEHVTSRRKVGGYLPKWVRNQLARHIEELGWSRGERYVNPNTGEAVLKDANGIVLLELLLEETVRPQEDAFFEDAEALGAVVTRLA